MSTLVTGARLRQAVESQSFIKGGDPASADAVKYDFHLGDRVLKAMYRQPKDIATIPEEQRVVEPSEAVFVLTRERLELPRDMIAVLTPKRRLAHDGIMILGGLMVDPKYRGFLLIGLYNFSSTPFPLLPGSKLIGAEFFTLSSEETQDFDPQAPEEITDFPVDLVKLIHEYKPTSLKAVQDQLADTQRQLESLRTDLNSDKQWRDDIKALMSRHDQQLETIIKALDKEQDIRRQEDEKLSERLGKMSNMFFGGKVIVWVASVIIAALITTGIALWLTHVFTKPVPIPNPPAASSAPPTGRGATAEVHR